MSFTKTRQLSHQFDLTRSRHTEHMATPLLTSGSLSVASFSKSRAASALCVSNSIGHAGDMQAAAFLTTQSSSLASFLKRSNPSSGWAFTKLRHIGALAMRYILSWSPLLTSSLRRWKSVSLKAWSWGSLGNTSNTEDGWCLEAAARQIRRNTRGSMGFLETTESLPPFSPQR